MRYRNAYGGVGKLYLAELIELVGVFFLAIGVFLGLLGISTEGAVSESATGGLAFGTFISIFPGIIMPIVGGILTLIGLKQASMDEPTYLRYAFICNIASIVILVASPLAGESGLFHWIMALLYTVTYALILVFTVYGIDRLVGNLGRQDLVSRGMRIIYLVIASQAADFINQFFKKGVLGTIISLLGVTISIVMYIFYLRYLKQAQEALRR